MKLTWSNSHALIAAAALVLLSNAIALGGVAYNRGGEPDSVLQLTERELPIQYWSWPENDNSAVHLELHWRVGSHEDWDWQRGLEWLKAEQLRELGFDLPPANATADQMDRYVRQSARRVYFALELDGPAYQTALARAHVRLRKAELDLATADSDENRSEVQIAKRLLEDEELRSSRLFVVAADRDAEALRKRYPDRQQYAIVRGRIDLSIGAATLVPQIDGIDTDTIRVPHAYRAAVEPFASQRTFERRLPRYAATVQFGRRLEPWIEHLSTM